MKLNPIEKKEITIIQKAKVETKILLENCIGFYSPADQDSRVFNQCESSLGPQNYFEF
jgi:hypothetical protein